MAAQTILIVDDDDDIRELLRIKLTASGHTIVTASNGAEGIKAMELIAFDLVITDVIMPIRGGLELIANTRSRNDKMPIIAISGGGRRGAAAVYLQSAQWLVADLVLSKPFSLSELTAAIHLMAA